MAVYPDMFMRRLNKSKKTKVAAHSKAYRDKLLVEMASRLRALAIVSHFKLEPETERLWSTFATAVKEISSPASKARMQWLAVDSELTNWEIVLLVYACGTGEMRNHQPVAAHVDVNKSHCLESMMLFGKVPMNACSDATATVLEMAPGHLILPYQMLAIEMLCGKDIIHLSLTGTMHLADANRGRTNWTCVHGP